MRSFPRHSTSMSLPVLLPRISAHDGDSPGHLLYLLCNYTFGIPISSRSDRIRPAQSPRVRIVFARPYMLLVVGPLFSFFPSSSHACHHL